MVWPFEAAPSPAWMGAISRWLDGSFWVAPGRARAAAEIGLWQDPSQEAPGPAGFIIPPKAAHEDNTPKGQIRQAPES